MHTTWTGAARRAGRTTMILVRSFGASTSGQDMIEFALLAGFIAVAIAATIPYGVTGPISSVFNKLHYYMVNYANG